MIFFPFNLLSHVSKLLKFQDISQFHNLSFYMNQTYKMFLFSIFQMNQTETL